MTNKKTKSSTVDFEASLKQLETIVLKMETGELNLEQALEYFEQGVALARQCQQTIHLAEQRIQHLLTDNDNPPD